MDRAIGKALKYPGLGKFVFALDFPNESNIEVRQTTRDKHPYTIYATGAALLRYVIGQVVPVEEE